MVFTPRREWCRATAVALGVPLGFASCVVLFLAGAIQAGHIGNIQVVSLIGFALLAFYYSLPFFLTTYEITDSELILRVGMHPIRIPLADIFALEASTGQLGMPAWSSDALKI